MTILECYMYVTDRLNKLSSNNSQNIPYPQFIRTFNTAQLQWVEDRYKIDETSNTRIDELSILLKSQVLSKSVKENYYETTKPDDYFHFKRLYGSPCNINIIPVKEGDINNLIKSANWRPSKDWEETISTIVGNTIRVYKDDNFSLEDIVLVYYRYPLEVDIAGYVKTDGTSSTDIDPEFKGSSLREILDFTVQILSGDINDVNRFNSISNKINQHT